MLNHISYPETYEQKSAELRAAAADYRRAKAARRQRRSLKMRRRSNPSAQPTAVPVR